MIVDQLSAARAAELRAQSLTYGAVGRVLTGPPAGHHYFARTRRIGGVHRFDDVAAALMSWQVQARSGLRVAASSPVVELDAVIVMRFGVGRVSITIPCRVVSIIDDPDRRGFAYGTLPGHPESGEEAFVVGRGPDGGIDFTVTAFSRPASMLARSGGPVTGLVQRWMTGRYLRALD